MKSLKLGICDEDGSFSADLAGYINECHYGVTAVAFTSPDSAKEFLSEEKLDAILLTDTSGCDSEPGERPSIMGVPGFLLLEEPEPDISWEIARYQNVRSLCSLIIKEIYPSDFQRPVLRAGSIAVFSPVGRSGKTRLAEALSRAFGTGGIYVGMEDYMPRGYQERPGDGIYHAMCLPGNAEERLLGMIDRSGGSGRLILSGSYLDSRALSKEKLGSLIKMLMVRGGFRGVIFDIGGGSLGDMCMLECFDRVLMPSPGDRLSDLKIGRLRDILTAEGYGDIERRLEEIKVPEDDSELRRAAERICRAMS